MHEKKIVGGWGVGEEYMNTRAAIFYTQDTVSWLYSKWFSSYGADTKLHLKPSRGNNSESMEARVVIPVRDTSSWPVLHSCEVS